MTLTQSSTRFAALTIGVAAIVAVAFSAALAAPAHAASICPGTTFNTNLKIGSHGAAVLALQQFLNMSADTQVSTSNGAGSPGNETTTFGGLTRAAVNKFQLKYAAQILTPNGLTTPTGNFYASSRAEANAICSGSVTTGTGTGTGTGTAAGTAVVAAAAQPANTLAPSGAARVPFTAFTVTANGAAVTVNSVTVQRQGPSLDTDFAGIVLIDAATGVQIGNSRVLDATHSATIGSAVTIPAGSSKTFWVAANIAAAPNAGDVASFAVTSVNTASSVQASYPITGASNTIQTGLTIGTATVQSSSFDPNSASTQPIGTSGFRFSGVRIQAGSGEDETFKSITWYNSGSASGLQNINVTVSGTSYPTTVDATGRYYTAVFPSGIVIPKGQSVDVYVTGDLGANTTASTVAEFDIYRNTDIYLTGNQYGFGISPTLGSIGTISVAATHGSNFAPSSTNQPFFQGSTVSVTAGTFSTIQNATSVGAQNIAINVPNQPLGGFQTNLTGEAITVQSLKVHFTTSSSTPKLTNVSLVSESGAVVAGPFDATCDATAINGACGSTAQTVTFSGSILFPTGTHTYTIQGQVPSATANNVTFQASTAPNSSDWSNVTGNVTGNNITPSAGSFTMNTMTVQAATLAVSNGTTPTTNSTVVSGGQNVLFATVQLDASQSGENVRLSSIPVTITTDSGTLGNNTTGTISYLSSCQIWNGTTALNTGSRVINAANISGGATVWTTTFSFDNSLVIPKGTVLNLPITCNLSSAAPSTATYAFAPTTSIAPSGVTSGSSVTVASIGGTAPTIKVSTGATLAGSTDSSSPAYTVVAGGTTGQLVNVIKFRATSEPVNLQKVGLKLTSGSASDITTAYLYTGTNVRTTAGVAIAANTLVGSVTFASGASTATSTLSTSVQLPADQDATLIVKADIAAIGTNKPGTDGDAIAIDYDSARGVGGNSGKTTDSVKAAGFAGSSGVRAFASFPVFAAGPTAPSNPNGTGQVLKKFTIAANNAGSIGLDKVSITVASTTGITLTNVKLIAYTDPNYSTAANVPGTTGGIFGATQANVTSGQKLAFSQTNAGNSPFELGAGQTVYFALVGDVAVNTSNSTWTISATVNGDASFSGMLNASFGNAPVVGNFVWTANATTTAGVADKDWSNGAGLNGLPSTGF
jgi:hypothetical protein